MVGKKRPRGGFGCPGVQLRQRYQDAVPAAQANGFAGIRSDVRLRVLIPRYTLLFSCW